MTFKKRHIRVYDSHASSMTNVKIQEISLTMHDDLRVGYSRNHNCIMGYWLLVILGNNAMTGQGSHSDSVPYAAGWGNVVLIMD